MKGEAMKKLTVAIDADSGDECLYIDGKRWEHTGERTVYAGDIAYAAGDAAAGFNTIKFRHVQVDCPGDWPQTIAELRDTDGNPI